MQEGRISPQPLQPLLFVLFDKGHSDWCELIHLTVALICISITFHDIESFSCDIFKHSASKTELSRLASSASALFRILFPGLTRDICWGLICFSSSPSGLVKIKRPSARGFLLLLPKAATRRKHFFMRHCFDCFVLANLTFFFCWSGVDFRCVCFRFTRTWSVIHGPISILSGVFPCRFLQCIQ